MPMARVTFVSRRERLLWIAAFLVVLAIFSTLALAPILSQAIRSRGLLDAGFVAAMVLVLLAAIAQGLRMRIGSLEVVVALAVVACYMLVAVRMALPEERTHLIEYGALALVLYEAFLERARYRRVPLPPQLMAIVGASLVGLVDELVQGLIPSRRLDSMDMIFNVLAALMAVASSGLLRWAHAWTLRRREG